MSDSEKKPKVRIAHVEIDGFKGIDHLSFAPTRTITVIGGQNGSGKSSVLDAIDTALRGGSAIPGEPVNHDRKKASVTDCRICVIRTVPALSPPISLSMPETECTFTGPVAGSPQLRPKFHSAWIVEDRLQLLGARPISSSIIKEFNRGRNLRRVSSGRRF